MSVSSEKIAQKALNVVAGVDIDVEDVSLFAEADCVVLYGLAGNVAVLDTDYTVTLNTVDYTDFVVTPTASLRSKIDAMLALDDDEEDQVVIRRSMALTTDITPTLARLREQIALEFDRTVLRMQEVNDATAGAVRVPNTETEGLDMSLPHANLRASRVMAFDENGLPDVSTLTLTQIQEQLTGAEAYADAAEASAASASSDSQTAAAASVTAVAAAAEAVDASGGVKVSGDDTTPGTLETKLLAGSGISLSTQNDGGSETRTIAVDAGTSAGNVVQLDGSAKLPAVDGSALTGIATGATESQASLLEWVADNLSLSILNAQITNGWAIMSLVDGFSDAFETEGGVDVGNAVNAVYDSELDLYANFTDPTPICEGGYDTQVFDGAGTTGNWSGFTGGNGVQNSSFGSVGGKTAWQFYNSATAGNTHAGITIDVGNWGKQFCYSFEIYVTGLSSMGVLTQGGGANYPMLNMATILDAGRRITPRLSGDGSIWVGNDGNQDVSTDAGVIQEATWHTVVVQGRMNGSNVVTDATVIVDGETELHVTGKAYTTSSTGSDGTLHFQLSGESGSATPRIHMHSVRAGQFVVSEGDQSYSGDYVTASDKQDVTSSNPGCQSFQVSDTNPIYAASVYVHDSTGLPATFDVHIRPDDGGAPDTGTSLASVTGVSAHGNNVGGTVTATFSSEFTPATSTTYWLCVENPSSTIKLSIRSSGSYASGNARYGGSDQSGADMHFAVLQSRGTGSDMTLPSLPQTALSVPGVARGVFVVQALDAVTLDTDLIAEFSRADGEWAAGSLTLAGAYSETENIYTADEVDLSAQTSDTDMRVRLRTANGKRVRAHAWTEQWR